MLGLERSLGSRIVTYADDLVILCRTGKAEEALQRLREVMGKLKLTVNEEKTRICRVREEEFDFLGRANETNRAAKQRPPTRSHSLTLLYRHREPVYHKLQNGAWLALPHPG
jgi:Reverse transcriptase (RNA-dependent DNA polymerase)